MEPVAQEHLAGGGDQVGLGLLLALTPGHPSSGYHGYQNTHGIRMCCQITDIGYRLWWRPPRVAACPRRTPPQPVPDAGPPGTSGTPARPANRWGGPCRVGPFR